MLRWNGRTCTPAARTAVARPKRAPVDPTTFDVYDTTLRDGAQQEGMNL